MRILSVAAAAAVACLLPAVASAQDAAPMPAQTDPAPATADAAPGEPAAPDGSKAFGIVPYVGVMGGYELFDSEAPGRGYNIPQSRYSNGQLNPNRNLQGGLVQGVVGVNVPLGPLFAGVEGNVAKGFTGNIDWEYGAAARAGVRAGDSGFIYGKVGYQWVQFDHFAGYTPGADTGKKYGDWTYGLGVEVGPKDIGLKGLTNNAGVRLRGEINTYGAFHSIRPMLGIVTHF